MAEGKVKRRVPWLPRRLTGRDVLILGALAAAGFAGNWYAIPLTGGVHLLLGGVATIFTALRRSLAETVLVAVIASLATVFVWGHPYAVITLTAEAAAVGTLYRCRGGNAVVYDLGFWIAAGTPFVLLFGPVALGWGSQGTALIALKQLVNGVAYTAIAVAIQDTARRRWPETDTQTTGLKLADVWTPAMVLFALVPALVGLSWHVHETHRATVRDVSDGLSSAAWIADPGASPGRGISRLTRAHQLLNRHREGRYAVAAVDASGTVRVELPAGWLSKRPKRQDLAGGVSQRTKDDTAALLKAPSAYLTRSIGSQGDEQLSGRLVIGLPAGPVVSELRRDQIAALGIVAALAILCVPAARLAASRETRWLNGLVQQLEQVRRSVINRERSRWPTSPVSEVRGLTDGMQALEGDLLAHIEALGERDERFRAITANLPGSIYQRVMDADGNIRFTYYSDYFAHMIGVSVDQVLADPWVLHQTMYQADWPQYLAAVRRSAERMEPVDAAFRIQDKDGAERWVRALGQPRDGGDGSVIWDGIAIDETQRKRAELELERLAYSDPVTDLLNRQGFDERLQTWLRENSWRPSAMVVMLGIQHLRDINEVYGFDAGDALLATVARRLEVNIDGAAIAARTGGGQFAVFVPATTDSQATTACDALDACFEEPFQLGPNRVVRRARFGMSRFGDTARKSTDLLREAQIALDHADGDSTPWCTYTDELEERTRQRVEISSELREALARDEFELHFQPKVDLRTGEVISAEALMRWWHPERGLQSPGVFIPIAEQNELIGPIGNWVLNDACRQLRAWRDRGLAIVRVSVNVSVVQLASGDFDRTVAQALARHDLDPSDLTLEVTESAFQENTELLRNQLDALHELGVRLSLDDFGTGYSSLLYLTQFPFDEIKIDKGFVMNMEGQTYNLQVISSVISLAQALGADVVAEGVESPASAVSLVDMGCLTGQGFYYSVPLANEDFEWLLGTGSLLPLAR